MNETDKAIALGTYTIQHWKPGIFGKILAAGIPYGQVKNIAVNRGALLHVDYVQNMVVSDGLNLMASRLLSDYLGTLSWHSIGTNSTVPALGQHILLSEAGRLALPLGSPRQTQSP